MFHMSSEMMNGFSIPDVLLWYVESFALKISDYLFPQLRGAQRGRTVQNGNLQVGYNALAMQLKRFCLKNRILVLMMHSARRGVATVVMKWGITRTKIQECGNWTSNAVWISLSSGARGGVYGVSATKIMM